VTVPDWDPSVVLLRLVCFEVGERGLWYVRMTLYMSCEMLYLDVWGGHRSIAHGIDYLVSNVEA